MKTHKKQTNKHTTDKTNITSSHHLCHPIRPSSCLPLSQSSSLFLSTPLLFVRTCYYYFVCSSLGYTIFSCLPLSSYSYLLHYYSAPLFVLICCHYYCVCSSLEYIFLFPCLCDGLSPCTILASRRFCLDASASSAPACVRAWLGLFVGSNCRWVWRVSGGTRGVSWRVRALGSVTKEERKSVISSYFLALFTTWVWVGAGQVSWSVS